MLIYLWNQPAVVVSTAGGPGKFHKKKRKRRKGPRPFDLPPVTEEILPSIEVKKQEPPTPAPSKPSKPHKVVTDISKLVRKPETGTDIIRVLERGLPEISITPFELKLPPELRDPIVPPEPIRLPEVIELPEAPELKQKTPFKPEQIKFLDKVPEVAPETITVKRPAGRS